MAKKKKFAVPGGLPKRFWIVLTAAVIWMGVIFLMSSRPADLSMADSSRMRDFLLSLMPTPELRAMLEHVFEVVPIRKVAHFTEYAVLGGLLLELVWITGRFGKYWTAIPLACSALYAASDELHQIFVPGRSAQVRDVLIDTGGALTGIAVVVLLHRIRKPSERGKDRAD